MSRIQNVIVAGAGGNLGPSIINALRAANFNVSVLSRETSPLSFSSHVTVVRTDYTPSSLARAFQGKDAVISVVGPMGILEQIKMIDAAAEAGVKRFMPSEFGADRRGGIHPDFEKLQQGKIRVFDHMVRKCEENRNLTWTSLATGPLLDWALLEFPAFGFDIRAKTATIYDSGYTPVTCTTRSSIGTAVAGVLNHPAESANKILRTCTAITTQNEILEAFEEVQQQKWNVRKTNVKDVLASANQALENKQFQQAFAGILVAQLFEDGTTRSGFSSPEDSDNRLLGVQSESIKTYIAGLVSSTAT